jgi:small nuclear ribonucleoprotein E
MKIQGQILVFYFFPPIASLNPLSHDSKCTTRKGFDEFMNLVLDNAEEIHLKTKTRKPIGRILLKGDNITLLQQAS